MRAMLHFNTCSHSFRFSLVKFNGKHTTQKHTHTNFTCPLIFSACSSLHCHTVDPVYIIIIKTYIPQKIHRPLVMCTAYVFYARHHELFANVKIKTVHRNVSKKVIAYDNHIYSIPFHLCDVQMDLWVFVCVRVGGLVMVVSAVFVRVAHTTVYCGVYIITNIKLWTATHTIIR